VHDVLSSPLFQRILVAGLLTSVACGVIGTYVVTKRIASLSGGLSHAAFGGIGLGYLAGFPPMLGAAAFGLAAALAVGVAQRRFGSGLDTLVSMVWSVGMALGLLFVALAPGYAPDLMSYLFGNILFVSSEYVVLVGAVDLVILASVASCHRLFEAVCFDEEHAEIAGVPADAMFLFLLSLAALAIVTLGRVVGVILAIALLTIPAATVRPWVDRLGTMMVGSVVVCAAAVCGGLLGSYALARVSQVSLPPGPLVVLLAATFYLLSTIVARVFTRSADATASAWNPAA